MRNRGFVIEHSVVADISCFRGGEILVDLRHLDLDVGVAVDACDMRVSAAGVSERALGLDNALALRMCGGHRPVTWDGVGGEKRGYADGEHESEDDPDDCGDTAGDVADFLVAGALGGLPALLCGG